MHLSPEKVRAETCSAIRDSIFSGDTFTQTPPNGGEYHTQMKLAAYVFNSTSKTIRDGSKEGQRHEKEASGTRENPVPQPPVSCSISVIASF
jgi:hypothetical protein